MRIMPDLTRNFPSGVHCYQRCDLASDKGQQPARHDDAQVPFLQMVDKLNPVRNRYVKCTWRGYSELSRLARAFAVWFRTPASVKSSIAREPSKYILDGFDIGS